MWQSLTDFAVKQAAIEHRLSRHVNYANATTRTPLRERHVAVLLGTVELADAGIPAMARAPPIA